MANWKYYPWHGDAHGRTALGRPINAAVEVIGDRWSLLVLRDVMFDNRRHFRVLQERSEEGSPRTSSPTACDGSSRPGC